MTAGEVSLRRTAASDRGCTTLHGTRQVWTDETDGPDDSVGREQAQRTRQH